MVALGFGILAFLAVSFFVISAFNVPRARRALLRQKIEAYVPNPAERARQNVEVRRVERPAVIRQLDELFAGTSREEGLSLEMLRADLPLRPGEYVAIRIGVAAILFGVVTLASGSFLLGAAMLPLTYVATRVFVRQRQKARLDAFERQLPEAIELVNSSLKAGFGLLQGLENVAREMPRPVKDEFSQIVRDISVGMQLEDALKAMNERVPSHDAHLLVTAILIHRTVGGNLAEVLAGITRTVRARLRTRDEVHALTTTQRVSSYVVTALPFLVLAVMYLMDPQQTSLLWTTQVGRLMLAAGGVMLAVGLFLSRRVIQFDY